MTTTASVQAEIERFLRSTEPEVLCITGEWGVGKTYNWQRIFDRLRSAKEIGLGRYSYVSLFGINSLEAFKQSIFENLEFILPESEAAFDRLLARGNNLFQQGKKAIGAVSAIPTVGGALDKLASPFLFSSIRTQIICVDDLERRGDGLSVKNVFGLISYLREQRDCKIVLLLNEIKLGESGTIEFNDYFEKVVETKVVFAPTATEAAGIAFSNREALSELISEYTIKLDVKNIRVLKKIERLIRLVLSGPIPKPSEKLLRQLVHSLVMLGWSRFDSGARPPSIEYLRRDSIGRTTRSEKRTPDEERWDAIRRSYEFVYLDDFDLALARFAESGILDQKLIRAEAEKQEERIRQADQTSSFANSFRKLHDSFSDNHDEVCHAIVTAFENNFDVVSLTELNQVVEVFERLGEDRLAEHVIKYAEQKAPAPFWLYEDPFHRPLSDRLAKIIEQKKSEDTPKVDFEHDLIAAAQTYDPKVIERLAARTPAEYLALFDSKEEKELRTVVLSALDYRKIANASPEMLKVVKDAEEALRMIGKRSALNAFRVNNFGVSLNSSE